MGEEAGQALHVGDAKAERGQCCSAKQQMTLALVLRIACQCCGSVLLPSLWPTTYPRAVRSPQAALFSILTIRASLYRIIMSECLACNGHLDSDVTMTQDRATRLDICSCRYRRMPELLWRAAGSRSMKGRLCTMPQAYLPETKICLHPAPTRSVEAAFITAWPAISEQLLEGVVISVGQATQAGPA